MDSYMILINKIEEAINKIKEKKEIEEAKLTGKCEEINALNSQRTIIDTNYVARKYYYEVITNYKNVTKEKRWWYILTFIGRSLIIALLAWLSTAILPNPTVIGFVIGLLELVVTGFTVMEYLSEVSEERRIKKQYNKEELLAYIEELEQNLHCIYKKIQRAKEEQNNIKTNISNLNGELNLLNAKLNGVKNKRNNVVATLLNENEVEINQSYTNDQELQKLERILING